MHGFPSRSFPYTDAITRWRYGAACEIGVAHTRAGTACDDRYRVSEVDARSGEAILIIAVSDGAGSAALSHQGAEITCDILVSELTRFTESRSLRELSRADACRIVDTIRLQLSLFARSNDYHLSDFACTLIGVAVSGSDAVYLQVGDGAIVTRSAERFSDWQLVFTPQHGEYLNETVFVTSPSAGAQVEFLYEDGPLMELCVFTDGVEHLAVSREQNRPHSQFFEWIVEPLRSRHGTGEQQPFSAWLRQVLSSPEVNGRTDDDKTIVVASRRCPS